MNKNELIDQQISFLQGLKESEKEQPQKLIYGVLTAYNSKGTVDCRMIDPETMEVSYTVPDVWDCELFWEQGLGKGDKFVCRVQEMDTNSGMDKVIMLPEPYKVPKNLDLKEALLWAKLGVPIRNSAWLEGEYIYCDEFGEWKDETEGAEGVSRIISFSPESLLLNFRTSFEFAKKKSEEVEEKSSGVDSLLSVVDKEYKHLCKKLLGTLDKTDPDITTVQKSFERIKQAIKKI